MSEVCVCGKKVNRITEKYHMECRAKYELRKDVKQGRVKFQIVPFTNEEYMRTKKGRGF